MKTPLDYSTLTLPQRRVIASFYNAAHGGEIPPFSANGKVILNLREMGWMEYGTHGLRITPAASTAYENHKFGKRTDTQTRDKMEKVARMARAALARLENAS